VDRSALAYLNDLNRSMDSVFAMLDKLTDYPELQKDYFQVPKANLREQLGNVNTAVLDALEKSEHNETYVAYKQRAAYERETRDPDDCYLMVLEREEELLRQGQPSRIGILLNTRSVTREAILRGDFAAETEDEEEAELGKDQSPQ
jgi:hypothetical protein